MTDVAAVGHALKRSGRGRIEAATATFGAAACGALIGASTPVEIATGTAVMLGVVAARVTRTIQRFEDEERRLIKDARNGGAETRAEPGRAAQEKR